jgi:hypothetical protein
MRFTLDSGWTGKEDATPLISNAGLFAELTLVTILLLLHCFFIGLWLYYFGVRLIFRRRFI